jgi:ectoine hydroxylase-related dioxygenase (phytanoyl-CoA dioxygenase family)
MSARVRVITSLEYSIENDKITELVSRRGMVAPKGEPGSVLFFHGNIVHGSSRNMSPCNRVVVIITYNSSENIPARGRILAMTS